MDEITEIWKPVVGWETFYLVSDLGRVQRIKKPARGRQPGMMKGSPNNDGYIQVRLSDCARHEIARVHRLVLRAFVGDPPEDKPQANHKNGQRADNALTNLEWSSVSDNITHSFRVLGRDPKKGTKNVRAKLSETDVLRIRELYAAGGMRQSDLAAQFSVNQTMIGFIVRRANWTHI